MTPRRITTYVLSDHAAQELARRGLSADIVRSVLDSPELETGVRVGRIALESRLRFQPEDRIYLVRVFVDVDREPAEVVTAYRTSKIAKYWRGGI